jgi:hypothetical protein
MGFGGTVTPVKAISCLRHIHITGSQPQSIAVGDFKGDGRADLVIISIQGHLDLTLLLGNGDGTFQSPIGSQSGASTADYIAVGDFNGDGKADLAIAALNGLQVTVLLGNGDATFKYVPSQLVKNRGSSIAVGGFNRDGNSDVAAPG